VARATHDHITLRDLPGALSGSAKEANQERVECVPLSQLERAHVLKVLRAVGGNKALAARSLGVDRTTLYRKLKAYGHDPLPVYRQRSDSHPD
jgi:two-component system response regulator HydG